MDDQTRGAGQSGVCDEYRNRLGGQIHPVDRVGFLIGAIQVTLAIGGDVAQGGLGQH